MFLFYLILFLFSNRTTNAINISTAHIPKIEDMYPLATNDQLELIAKQFHQNPNWEQGNIPISLTEDEETTPNQPISQEWQTGPGVVKTGHLFHTEDMHAYRIDYEGVHPHSEHHIFVIRHGVYFYTEDDPSAHLLRYGKYQARMAGHKINKKIHELIQQSGPLTRPIKLVSSTQTRAFETLYNIRLQLSNNLKFEKEVIQDTGLTECIDPDRQRIRWLYFVREYLQPIKSKKREHTITIIASHGNLLTTFDHIIRQFINKNEHPESFSSFVLPVGTGLSHAETILYRSIGAKPVYLKHTFMMNEIPITVNHGQLRKDFYYEWAAMHQCRSNHGREDMKNYIRSAILDNIFSKGQFDNKIPDYETIVYLEMSHEYDTHLLPMLMHTCRSYLYRLPFTQANTNFETFSRLTSPVPVPETEEEQRSPLNISFHQFNAYSMPYPVNNQIQKFRKNPIMTRERIPHGVVHPESRTRNYFLFYILRLNVDTGDEKTSYLTRLGINQIRGVMSHVHSAIYAYRQRLAKETHMYPINIIAEPTIESAESCFHVRSLLIDSDYKVSKQITDLGLQYNYFQKKSVSDFIQFQRVQILYMLRHYLAPDQNNATHPSLRVYILCGDGRLFTAFRQEMALRNLLIQPYPRFSTFTDPGFNALKHGNGFFFEAIGDDMLKLHDVLTLATARGIQDEQRVATDQSLQIPMRELKYWFRSQSGPCTLSYFLENRDRLSLAVVNSASFYPQHIARLLKTEWNPYLAGLFIYACRLQFTLSGACNTYRHQAANGNETVTAAQCNEQAAICKGPSGDCI